jgi:hypothetical protein
VTLLEEGNVFGEPAPLVRDTHRDSAAVRSPSPNDARGTASPSARGTSGRRGPAGRRDALGARLWLRRPQRRRPRCLVGIDPY